MKRDYTRLIEQFSNTSKKAQNFDLSIHDPAAAMQLNRAQNKILRKQQLFGDKVRAVKALWNQWLAEYENHRKEAAILFRNRKPPLGCPLGGTLLAQLSDLHFGALLEKPGGVGYDMEVAAKRLRLYAQTIIRQQLATGADRLVIALTGDLVDSLCGKERLDKILQSDTPQHQAMMMGADLIISFITELQELEVFGSIMVAGVAGNESRQTGDVAFGDKGGAENLDCNIHAILDRHFRGSDVETSFELFRNVIQVEDQRVLLIHGHTLPRNMDQKQLHGILTEHGCDFGISGHIHFAYTTSEWARSASLMGADGYAENGLLLFAGRASQNLIHFQGLNRSVMVVDLENCLEVEGYPLQTYSGAYGGSNEQRFELTNVSDLGATRRRAGQYLSGSL